MSRKSIYLLGLCVALFLFPLGCFLFLTGQFPEKRATGRLFPQPAENSSLCASPKGASEPLLLHSRNPFRIILSRLSEKRPMTRTATRRGNGVPLFSSLLRLPVSGLYERGHHAVYYFCPIIFHQYSRIRPVRAGPPPV